MAQIPPAPLPWPKYLHGSDTSAIHAQKIVKQFRRRPICPMDSFDPHQCTQSREPCVKGGEPAYFPAPLCDPPANHLRRFEERSKSPVKRKSVAIVTAAHFPRGTPRIALLVYSCCAKCTEFPPPQRPRWWSTILSMCQSQLIFT